MHSPAPCSASSPCPPAAPSATNRCRRSPQPPPRLPALHCPLPRPPSLLTVRHATCPGERRADLARNRRSWRNRRNPTAAAGPFSSPTTTGDTHATPCTRQRPALHPRPFRLQHRRRRTGVVAARNRRPVAACRGRNRVGRHAGQGLREDRKSVGWGKRVSVSVDVGVRRVIKKKKTE